MLTFRSPKTVAIGEAMIEMAVIGDDTYRRSFAGDTFNTAWHMAQLMGASGSVGFVTKVGHDASSNAFIQQLARDGLKTTCVEQISDRKMGLYMIALEGTERHFQYWRSQSAARLLAEDPDWLATAIGDAGLIHLSGITLAILTEDARDLLWDVLSTARDHGARLSFDPNVRPQLWTSRQDTKRTLSRFFEITDIALPSFDDEAKLWGDVSPRMTLERLKGVGISEIAIKNGAGVVIATSDAKTITVDTPAVSGIRDTSGAGDAFNAGYLAARLIGRDQYHAIKDGQLMSSEVIQHFGARIPKTHIPKHAEGTLNHLNDKHQRI